MAALLSEKIERLETGKLETGSKTGPLLAGFAFVVGLLPCLFHSLVFCESRIMLATDGKHFLHTVSLLVEYLKQIGNSGAAAKFLADTQLSAHVLFDGPIMSLVYSPLFLVLNKVPTPRDWQIMAVGQSVFHACTTTLLTFIVLRLTRSPLFAVMAALLYGLYPPAVLQSGHFMSELPITTLLVLFVFLLTRQTKRIFLSYLAAAGAGSLIVLSKPALIPCVVLVSIFALWNSVSTGASIRSEFSNANRDPFLGSVILCLLRNFVRRRVAACAGLFAGFALILSVWSAFCFDATGSFFPTAQRQPLYNVVTGWNVEADGWAYNPHPPLTEVFTEADGPLTSAAGIWMSHPEESFRLAISKVSRLVSCSWNDFKGRALGLDENAQLLIHRLIVACALFGASVFLLCSRQYLNDEQRRILKTALLLICCHLTYLMVECQPRYSFTAMPFAVLLAIYGFWQVSSLSFQDKSRSLIVLSSLVMALGSTAFLLHSENICNLFDPRSLKEKAHLLKMNDSVEKILDFSGSKSPVHLKDLVLLVDGDKALEKSQVEINGTRLSASFLPTSHFDSAHYVIYDQLREFGPSMRIAVDDFRQWRAIPLDPALIHWQGKNSIVITSKAKEATIYGDSNQNRHSLSPDYCNYGLLAAAPVAAGAESRYTEPILTAASEQASFIMPKTERRNSLKDSLRVRLLATLDNNATTSQNASEPGHGPPTILSQQTLLSPAAAQKELVKIQRESFDRMLWDTGSTDLLRINKVILYSARSVGAEIPLPKLLRSSHLKIRIKGELKALKNSGDVGLLSALKGANGQVQILGKNPRALQASEKWRQFQIDDLVPLAALGGSAESIELALYPCPWMEGQYGVSRRACDALFRNITIETESASLPFLSARRIVY